MCESRVNEWYITDDYISQLAKLVVQPIVRLVVLLGGGDFEQACTLELGDAQCILERGARKLYSKFGMLNSESRAILNQYEEQLVHSMLKQVREHFTTMVYLQTKKAFFDEACEVFQVLNGIDGRKHDVGEVLSNSAFWDFFDDFISLDDKKASEIQIPSYPDLDKVVKMEVSRIVEQIK